MKSCVQLQSCVQLHVSNYIFCYKAIVVTTGTAHCFHDLYMYFFFNFFHQFFYWKSIYIF